MSALISCTPDCTPVNVPGTQGPAGNDGANGVNAYTYLTATLTIPTVGANVTASVSKSTWMAIGQVLMVSDGTNMAHFSVVSMPTSASATLQNLGYINDTAPTGVIATNAAVSPSGPQGFTPPLAVSEGGTAATSAASARTNLRVPASTSAGTVTVNGATAVVVSDTTVTANSVIIFTLKTVGGTPAGAPYLSAVTAGTSFSVKAAAGDTSVYNYLILN